MKIRNIAPGARGLHTTTGTHLLEPGQEIEAEMTPAEHASSHRTGWFDMPAPDEDDGLDREALKARARELGLDHAPKISTRKLKELVESGAAVS